MEQINSKTGKTAIFLLLAGGFLAALKFGSIAVMPEIVSLHPETFFEYIFISLPTHSFGLLAGIILILLCDYRKNASVFVSFDKINLNTPGFAAILMLALLIPAAGLPGCHGKNANFLALYYLNHYAACGAFALAAYLIFSAVPEVKKKFFLAVSAGVLVVSLAGLYQYFIGFVETRDFVISEAGGVENLHPVILARLNDTRVYATMTNANILAGFLLLTMPLYYFCACKLSKRITEPKKILPTLFFWLAVAPVIAVFLMTKSRGAFFAAALTGIFFVFDKIKKRSLRIAAIAIIAGAILGGAYYIHTAGRGFSSLAERFDYCRTALITAVDSPLAGNGWGTFQRIHMKMKLSSSDEAARDPHNIILAFLCMCGIPAGIAVAATLLFIACLLFKKRSVLPENAAIFYGVLAFLLHAMIEVDHMVPASWATFGALSAAALCENEKKSPARIRGEMVLKIAMLLSGMAIFASSAKIVKSDYDFARCQSQVSREGALEKLYSLLKKYPDDPVFVEYAGRVYFSCGDLVNAEKYFQHALDLVGDDAGIYHTLAELEYRRGNCEAGNAYLRKAKEFFPAKYGNINLP